MTGTAPISQGHQHLHLISLSQVSSLAFQILPFYQEKTKVWWHLVWLSGVSGVCVFMCTDVCTHLSLSSCFTCTRLGGLCVPFPRKKLLMPFPPPKWRQSQVQFLACSYPDDTVTQRGKPSKRHLLLCHMTGSAFGMHNLSAAVSDALHELEVKRYFWRAACGLLFFLKRCFFFGIWVSVSRALMAPTPWMLTGKRTGHTPHQWWNSSQGSPEERL